MSKKYKKPVFYAVLKTGEIRKISAEDEIKAVDIAQAFYPDLSEVGTLRKYVKITNKERKQIYEDIVNNAPAILASYVTAKRKKKE